jgi:hypothetical protein
MDAFKTMMLNRSPSPLPSRWKLVQLIKARYEKLETHMIR